MSSTFSHTGGLLSFARLSLHAVSSSHLCPQRCHRVLWRPPRKPRQWPRPGSAETRTATASYATRGSTTLAWPNSTTTARSTRRTPPALTSWSSWARPWTWERWKVWSIGGPWGPGVVMGSLVIGAVCFCNTAVVQSHNIIFFFFYCYWHIMNSPQHTPWTAKIFHLWPHPYRQRNLNINKLPVWKKA